jgi:hypothetical protein
MSNGALVRAWRHLFGRDVHSECRKTVEQERQARQWERESLYALVRELQAKLLEVADPGINHRLTPAAPKKDRPAEPKPKHQVLDMLPGIN